MYCKNCGEKLSDDTKFCGKCGTAVINHKQNTTQTVSVETKVEAITPENKVVANSAENKTETIIKCGSCEYIGPGELARHPFSQALAWLCVIICWPITVIYFLATSKYRCPKCKSTFLGYKNKEGIFVGQKKSPILIVVVCIILGIAVIGILSSVVLASLNSARGKGSDAAAESGMSNFQAQAAIYYDGTGQQSYASDTSVGDCNAPNSVFTDPQSSTIIQTITQNVASISCDASPSTYAILVTLKGAGTTWCVDSSGNATAATPYGTIAADGLCI